MSKINRKNVAMGVIKTMRGIAANSPANSWKVTASLKGAIFHYAYGKGEEKIHFFGSDYIVPTKDISLVPSLVGGYYEKLQLTIFSDACSAGATVIDIGANLGVYAVTAAKVVGDAGRVYAFEPVKENIRLLSANLALNNLGNNVEIIGKAAGAKDETIRMYLSKDNVGTHSASKATAQSNDDFEQVEQVRIDSFVDQKAIEKVDVIKIDVEGYDGWVVMGGLNTLKKHQPILFMEFIPSSIKQSGVDVGAMLSELKKIYSNCMVIDEHKGVLHSVDDTLELEHTKIANANLLFFNSDKNSTWAEGLKRHNTSLVDG